MKIAVVAFSSKGCSIALKLKELLPEYDVMVYSKTKYAPADMEDAGNLDRWVKSMFETKDALIFIGSSGIAVRHIAPYLKSKDKDPAVLCMDDSCRFVIPLVSGHIGGANALAKKISEVTESIPVITTGTDVAGLFAVDVFATENNLFIRNLKAIKPVSAAILEGKKVCFSSEVEYNTPPSELTLSDEGEIGVCVSFSGRAPYKRTLSLIPKTICVGVGCRRGIEGRKLIDFVEKVLQDENILPEAVGYIASVDLKKDEPAIHDVAKKFGISPTFLSSNVLMNVDGEFTSSDFVMNVVGVDNVCERAACSSGGKLIRKKVACNGMTVALAKKHIVLRF